MGVRPRPVFFGPSYELYAFDTKEMKSDKVVTDIVSYGISADRQKIVYCDGDFTIIKVGKKAGAGAKPSGGSHSDEKKSGKLDIKSKTRMKLDRTAEWKQILDEYLVDETHNKITITTNDKPTLSGAVETTFPPLGGDGTIRYKITKTRDESAIERPPEMEVRGRDVQLEKAIEFLMGKIGNQKSGKNVESPVEKR